MELTKLIVHLVFPVLIDVVQERYVSSGINLHLQFVRRDLWLWVCKVESLTNTYS